MDSMVRTAMAIKREKATHGASETRVQVTKGRRASLLLVRERSRRLLVHEGFRDRVTTIMTKVKLGLLAS